MLDDKGTRNVVQLGITFMLQFFAYMSLEFIQEPLIESAAKKDPSIDIHAGYQSFAITYLFYTASCLVVAPVVNWISPKWAMVIGLVTSQIFMAGFLSINEAFLLSSSVLLGLGASFLWVGHGAYLAQNCTSKTIERNSSILWVVFKASLVAGGVYLYFMFRNRTISDVIEDGTIRYLCVIFICVSLLATVNTILLPEPEYRDANVDKSVYQNLIETGRLMLTAKMALLAVVFLYAGLSRSFWIAIFPACIKFTSQLGGNTTQLLALSAIATGVGQMLAGILLTMLGRRARVVGKDAILAVATVLHVVCFVAIFLTFPFDAPLHTTDNVSDFFAPSAWLALVCSGVLGLGDAIIQTQIYGFIIDEYPTDSTYAFAIFKFYSGASTAAAFFYSKQFTLGMHLTSMTVTLAASTICVVVLQRCVIPTERAANKTRTYPAEVMNGKPIVVAICESETKT